MADVLPSSRRAVFARDGYTCQATALGGDCDADLTIHHLLPRHSGGSNRQGNLLTVCDGHHTAIHQDEARAAKLDLIRPTEPPAPPGIAPSSRYRVDPDLAEVPLVNEWPLTPKVPPPRPRPPEPEPVEPQSSEVAVSA